MRVVIQRVLSASVEIDNKIYNKIDKGYLILTCFMDNDTIEDLNYMAKKIINLRIFEDENGKMNKSILDVNASILNISQFTLAADTSHGNRPSFTTSLKPDLASKYYDEFNDMLNEYVPSYKGIFASDMKVSLINDGPITICIDSKQNKA